MWGMTACAHAVVQAQPTPPANEASAPAAPQALTAPDAVQSAQDAQGTAAVPESAGDMTPQAAAAATVSADAEASPEELGAVVVTGSRSGQARTVAQSPTPIDVIQPAELQNTGRTGLKEILGAVVPSFTLPAQGGGGTSASVKPYTYRGLTGDYALVLVNGKRRHTTSLINNLSRVAAGSTPVDLDLIAAPAIGHLEILKDGAAAQYGSDAIAGVFNFILDDAPEGVTFSQTAGQTYTQGAPLLQQTFSIGTPLWTKGGFFRFSTELKYHAASTSSGYKPPLTRPDGSPNYIYAPGPNGEPDPREAAAHERRWAGGYGRSNSDIVANFAYNAELPLWDKFKLYSFSTLSYRNVRDRRGTLLPMDANVNTLPEIYPNGFQAYRRIYEWDGQATFGVKHEIAGFRWDLSSSYGRDYVRLGAENVLNPSLGPTSPTKFFMGKQKQDLWVNNLDISKSLDIGLKDPLELAFGLEHRWERFQNEAGEPDSYRDGGYMVPTLANPDSLDPRDWWYRQFGGRRPIPGLASFTGTSPDDARVLDRHNIAAYVDGSVRPVHPWFIGVAGRAEHYTDSAGDTLSGKITTRYDILPGLAVRGGVNTGFRAPSLAQTGFSTTQNTGTLVGGEFITTVAKFLPVDSKAAKALGATPLKPEKSLSFTGGVTVEVQRFRLTVDGFQTKIRDRISKTEFIGTANNGGAAIAQLLADNGVPNVQSAQFFLNALDSTTRGVDIVAEYTLRHRDLGTFRPTAAFSYAKTKIDRLRDNPAVLAPLNVTLFGRQAQRDFEASVPTNKLVLGANWQIWRIKADARVTQYGSYIESSTVAANDLKFGAKWITDVDVSYGISDSITLAVGATNLFNVYPDKRHGFQEYGLGQYGSFAPFGLTGGFYYARLNATF